jgi:hypothetical protein
VLDPVRRSGSTLTAAQDTGRMCCGVERDPFYVDVMIRRYQASTGIAAILADSGGTFEQVAARRRDDNSDSVAVRASRCRPDDAGRYLSIHLPFLKSKKGQRRNRS